jgi:hypothetical protein
LVRFALNILACPENHKKPLFSSLESVGHVTNIPPDQLSRSGGFVLKLAGMGHLA